MKGTRMPRRSQSAVTASRKNERLRFLFMSPAIWRRSRPDARPSFHHRSPRKNAKTTGNPPSKCQLAHKVSPTVGVIIGCDPFSSHFFTSGSAPR